MYNKLNRILIMEQILCCVLIILKVFMLVMLDTVYKIIYLYRPEQAVVRGCLDLKISLHLTCHLNYLLFST